VIKVELSFPDQAALIAFFSGSKPLAVSNVESVGTTKSATVTPEKQQAARDSAAKAQAVADLAKVKADIIGGKTATTADDKTPAAETGKVAPTVDYPTLQKAVFELVGLVKKLELDPAEHVLGIAKSFNYANFAAMKEAGPAGAMHFADALAAVKAKHAELSEPAVA
jgi:hypothetical protein